MNRTKKQCDNCKSWVSLSNFERHISGKSCQYGGINRNKPVVFPWEDWKVSEDFYKLPCGYKGNKIACKNFLINRKVIQENGVAGNFSVYNAQLKSLEKTVHNKGQQLKQEQKDKISIALKSFRERNPLSFDETYRKKLSASRKIYLANNPEAHPNRKLAGNRSKMTYPEKVAFDWFNRKGLTAEHNKKIDKFYPDFVIEKVIVEIDGERWHSSPEQQERDRNRDEILKSLGYTVHRIPSKERIEERLEKIFS